jgi:hypothetical protein
MGKRIEDMTTDETMEKLFPKDVIDEADEIIGKKGRKRGEHAPSDESQNTGKE